MKNSYHNLLEIRGGGGGRGAVSFKIFSTLRASVWSKNGEEGEEGGTGRAPPMDPPLDIATLLDITENQVRLRTRINL